MISTSVCVCVCEVCGTYTLEVVTVQKNDLLSEPVVRMFECEMATL